VEKTERPAADTDVVAAFARVEARPRAPFLVDAEGEVSWGELCTRTRKVATLLAGWGLGPGARVLLASREDRALAALFLGLLRCGVTPLLLDANTGPERARRLVEVGRPDACIVDRALVSSWGLDGHPNVLPVDAERPRSLLARLRGEPAGDGNAWPGCLAALEPGPLPAAVDPDVDAYVLFTSGTTADPKGVRITHRGLYAHLGTLGRVYGFDAQSRIFNNLLLAHADGIVQGPALALAHAIPVVRTVPFRIQALDELIDALYRHRITHLVAVPTMLALLERYRSKRTDAFATGDFRVVISCGAHLDEALWRRFESTYGVPVVNVFGLTETVAGGIFAGPGDETRRHGTVGRPVDCEARIVDEGRVLDDGEDGELQMRGPLVTAGYLNNPEATARVLDGKGWFSTGDVARRDGDGFYRIRGRRKALIIRGGFNVHPEEVTEALQAHPGVAEAITIGLPDPIWGEQVVSAVVPASPGPTEEELVAYCRSRMEEQKVPSRILAFPELPRGLSQKVRLEEVRRLVVEALAAGSAHAETGGGDVESALLAEAAACFRVPPGSIDLDTTPDSLPSWDSLGHLAFVAALEERFGIAFSPDEIVAIDSLRRAALVVSARRASG
jgi:long-chain acyl-CoA synthetase